jgi:perosamine synthetase
MIGNKPIPGNLSMKIPMSSPDLTDADRQAVMDVINTPILSLGPKVQEFERAFCEYTGARHAVAVNSGTAGLHLAVRACGIGAGDLVITTPFSFVASTNALLFENAIPVFVDVDPVTGNIDPDQVARCARDLRQGGRAAEKWLPRNYPGKSASGAGALKAILPVDVFGQPAALGPINNVAREHGIKVIEDSCEAIGALYQDKKAGRHGDFGIFAFYPNKQMTTGEGGLVITDDADAADFMRALRNQGRAVGDTWLSHTHLGYNYRLDELSAALGLAQIRRLDDMLAKREIVAGWYAEGLSDIPGIETPVVIPETTRMSWFVYVIRLAREIDRAALAKRLEARGVPIRPYFLPIHLQPYMVERFRYQPGDFPVTEDLGQRGVAVPFSGVMSREQVEYVCEALRQEIGNS